MQGLKFFSIFTFLFLSLFIQKTCDVSSLLFADHSEHISSADKTPHIQTAKLKKIVLKQKGCKTPFIAASAFQAKISLLIHDNNVLNLCPHIPKLCFENPSRAPPVV